MRETTVDESIHALAAPPQARGLRIVVVWHRDPERIGARAWVPWSRPGDSAEISRQEPAFSDGAPLDDLRISRSPLQLVATPGGVECWPSRGGLRFDVDGVEGTPGQCVPTAALVQGVLLGLGRGVLLHVRLGPPPRSGRVAALVGASEELERIGEAIERAIRSDACVLVLGVSRSGMELVAQAVHALGPRAGHRFVAVNMAAVAGPLAPSQLFGHVRGAFTGADAASAGYFGEADRGTLFLDEIGACPPEVQAQLLRALEAGEVQVVGGPVRRVDVRVVAATDADLRAACAAGTFRAPLFHRLAHTIVELPPLRARPVDVAVQAAVFLREKLRRSRRPWPAGGEAPWLGREVVEALMRAPWPGNSRELRATVERLVDEHGDRPACGLPALSSVPPRCADAPDAEPPPPTLLDLATALARCDYRLGPTAELLGISRNALKRRMEVEKIRRPIDLDASEIGAALSREGGVRGAARALGVSEHGLRLRMGELGLAGDT